MPKHIYLDHAATTPVRPEVMNAMLPYFMEKAGNPGGLYQYGREAKIAVDDARASVAKSLNCKDAEVIFTGSGTESDNLALTGFMRANKAKGNHLITTTFEHHAVLRTAQALEKEGFDVTYVEVDRFGLVSPAKLKEAIRDDTVLVSIMYANNEIGTVQDIPAITLVLKELNAERVKEKKPKIFFHTDACQAAGHLPMDVEALGVDMLTLNGSKIYAPKGVGVLYLRRGTQVHAIIHGGGQERKLRSGTESVPLIIGLAKALELARLEREQESARLIALRNKLIHELLARIPKSFLNGHPVRRLPNNANITFLDIEGEAMLLYLDELGISASTGSACTSGDLEPSHVILALGLPYEAAHGSLRLTMGRDTTEEDIDFIIAKLPSIIAHLRRISPVVVDMKSCVIEGMVTSENIKEKTLPS